jgi:patatin-like phospholipase/acyl hydrolase
MQLHQYFDMICGTSTGGLIAIAIGLLHKDAKWCENFYLNEVGMIFGKRQPFGSSSAYDAYNLEILLTTISQGKAMKDFQPKPRSTPHVFVVGTNADNNASVPVLFRNYSTSSFHWYQTVEQILVQEAGRATSAAPSYFTPLVRGNALTMYHSSFRRCHLC